MWTRTDDHWRWVEKSETAELYARTLTKFVAAAIRSLHRNEQRFRLPLTSSLEKKAGDLFERLESLPAPGKKPQENSGESRGLSAEEKNAMISLQDFFFSAVTESTDSREADKFTCPILTYIACFAYNDDDTFKVAPQITSMLAQWLFILRCTALYHGTASSTKERSLQT